MVRLLPGNGGGVRCEPPLPAVRAALLSAAAEAIEACLDLESAATAGSALPHGAAGERSGTGPDEIDSESLHVRATYGFDCEAVLPGLLPDTRGARLAHRAREPSLPAVAAGERRGDGLGPSALVTLAGHHEVALRARRHAAGGALAARAAVHRAAASGARAAERALAEWTEIARASSVDLSGVARRIEAERVRSRASPAQHLGLWRAVLGEARKVVGRTAGGSATPQLGAELGAGTVGSGPGAGAGAGSGGDSERLVCGPVLVDWAAVRAWCVSRTRRTLGGVCRGASEAGTASAESLLAEASQWREKLENARLVASGHSSDAMVQARSVAQVASAGAALPGLQRAARALAGLRKAVDECVREQRRADAGAGAAFAAGAGAAETVSGGVGPD